MHDTPILGERAWVCRDRLIFDGRRYLQAGMGTEAEYFPIEECRPLSWQPTPGMQVVMTARWSVHCGLVATIDRIYLLSGKAPVLRCRFANPAVPPAEWFPTWVAPYLDGMPLPEPLPCLVSGGHLQTLQLEPDNIATSTKD